MASPIHAILLGPPSQARRTLATALQELHTAHIGHIDEDFAAFSLRLTDRTKWRVRPSHTLKLYAVFCWMVFSQEAFAMLTRNEPGLRAQKFKRVLTRSLLFLLHGLTTQGGMLPETATTTSYMRKLDFFVLHMLSVYAHM